MKKIESRKIKAGVALIAVLMIAMSSVSAFVANSDDSGTIGNLSVPRADPYIDIVNVTLNATDDLSGVAYTVFRIENETNWLPYQGTFSVQGVGNYTISFYSVDVAGNIEATQSVSFDITTDVSAPVTICTLEGATSYP